MTMGTITCFGRATVARLHRYLLAVAIVLIALGSAQAQRTTGTLRGEVIDGTGRVIEGATVVLTNEASGVSQTVVTNSAGTYIFPDLLPGSYTLKVTLQGFREGVTRNLRVLANAEVAHNVSLEVGAIADTVEVNASSAVVDTTTATIGTTFDSREVVDLPTGSSSPLQLSIFAANTTAQQGGISGVGGSVGGARPNTNSFTLDGVDDNNTGVTGNNTTVIQDAVAEFNLVQNQFSAEYSRAAAGQFNIVTKTGTNNWHGTGQYYVANRNLNALDNLTKQALADGSLDHIPHFDQNRVGATAGGPIVKNRLFIFGAAEYLYLHQDGNQATVLTPTASGFATLNSLAANPSVQNVLSIFPVATAQTQGQTITVDGQAIPVGNAVLFSPSYFRQPEYQLNGDLKLGKHMFGARFVYNHLETILPANTPQDAFNQTQMVTNYKIALIDAWTISNSLVNDLRISYSHTLQNDSVKSQFASFNQYHIQDLSGLDVGPNDPQRDLQDAYQILNNQTYLRGRHTFKYGAEYRHFIAPASFLSRSFGDYFYGSMEELVNDSVPSLQALRGAGTPLFKETQSAIYWFVQDDVKVSRKFTLNVGLRYEFTNVPASAHSQVLNAAASVPGVIEFRDPKPATKDFAPRVGFAWDPQGTGKTSIRGGFGIGYIPPYINLAQLALPPQLQTEENVGLVCNVFAPAPAWCATGTGFLSNGGLPATYTLPSDPNLARALTQGVVSDAKDSKIMNWSFGVQHELYRGGVLEARYLGSRGQYLPLQVRLNSESAFAGGLQPLPTYLSAASVPATVTAPSSNLQEFDNWEANQSFKRLLPDGFEGNVTQHVPEGSSIYHGGSISFTQSLRRGFTARANYTYSHNIDNSTAELFSTFLNPRRAQDGFNLAAERGNSALDVRHKLAVGWTYLTPQLHSGNFLLRALLNTYDFDGTYVAQTGQPVTILSPYDANANGDIAGDRAILNPAGIGNTSTDVAAVCNAGTGGATSIVTTPAPATAPGNWLCGNNDDANIVGYVALDPKARYVATQLGAKSNLGRNTFYSPGFGQLNLSLAKNTRVGEGKTLMLRVELYDALNHRNFTVAGGVSVFSTLTNINALSFPGYNLANGQSTFLNSSLFSGGSRNLQLTLKYMF